MVNFKLRPAFGVVTSLVCETETLGPIGCTSTRMLYYDIL